MTTTPASAPAKVASGIAGLDEILDGGFPRHHTYLVQGRSGSGKTTLGLQFILAGLEAGETVLYITLSETERELREIADSHGWSLEGVHVHELRPAQALEELDAEQTIFHPADIELGEAIAEILKTVEEIKPERAVLDSITEIHLLAESPLRYRRQLMTLRRALVEIDCTALFMNSEPLDRDLAIHSLVHGSIELDQMELDYGDDRRRLRVAKMRGMPYHGGYHDYRIVTGGLEVYPRLKLSEAAPALTWTPVSSGIDELDVLLGKGLHSGTGCMMAGQTGTGKSTLVTQYICAAAQRGERSQVFLFEENRETLYRRAEGIGIDIRRFEQEGLVSLHQIDTGVITPGEFIQTVRQSVTENEVKLVVIDSLNGYLNAMPQERLLLIHMHELLAYLSQHDVLTLLTITHRGVVEPITPREIDLSYLVDTFILLRHFEARGAMRRAISVIKKRHGPHEKTIRELRITSAGLEVGPALTAFSGVLSGRPRYEGETGQLLNDKGDEGQDD